MPRSGRTVFLNWAVLKFTAQFWDLVLSRFKVTSESLQKADMDPLTAFCLFESLRTWDNSLIDQFDHFERYAVSVPIVCQSYKGELQHTKKT